ncbi:CAP domain-containing protein [Paenibacillus thalictri]|uniref:LysM peptidoglycan-binding domain-containing protein n=1 Tax=Paenibacillus thalictri TaxID=2527873 RepID=A0A4Q9DZ48_9BACL|nr:CAP domain-containing protein [Paenibacillus thalictri]TBL81123.1 LysM peptidoglycan-binding domain-containing protein [Paenibacillus thalictri]
MFRFKKSVLTGALAISTLIGATAASAAPYTVTSNDTMWKISQKYGVDLTSLLQMNPQVTNANNIWPGIVLNIPGWSFGSGYWFSGGSQQGVPTTGSQTPGSGNGSTSGSGSVGTGSGSTNPGSVNSGSGSANSGSANSGSTSGSVTSTSAFASQVVALVNQERAKSGLKSLASDSALSSMALDKAKDMYTNNYFDHTSPTYGSPFDMMRSYGISYTYAGENIAKGQQSPQEVMNSWMNSAGHRQNILSPNYTKIGVAYYNGEWVQEFIAN